MFCVDNATLTCLIQMVLGILPQTLGPAPFSSCPCAAAVLLYHSRSAYCLRRHCAFREEYRPTQTGNHAFQRVQVSQAKLEEEV